MFPSESNCNKYYKLGVSEFGRTNSSILKIKETINQSVTSIMTETKTNQI